MNCPSRTDESRFHPDWNQNPPSLSPDLTTRADFNGAINLREERAESSPDDGRDDCIRAMAVPIPETRRRSVTYHGKAQMKTDILSEPETKGKTTRPQTFPHKTSAIDQVSKPKFLQKIQDVLCRYAQFVGPGFLIAVAYIDPGNYATDVQAGASTQYAHLFVVLMSNLIAIFLQSLCIKLGSVTGLNLAENCREHLPRWLTITLYIFSEAAIIATDIAEVIGSAIALNLLLHIPLVAGCAITLVDVLLLLLFYKPDGSMTKIRIFEYFVMALVFGVMICFCIQLSYLRDTSPSMVFHGYLPSSAVINGNGIYLSCGILGATVMPHSIFLGSGVVQPRLRQFDEQAGTTLSRLDSISEDEYRPSVNAIRTCLKYSIVELATSLFTFALFVNSAILIVAGSSLYPETAASDADLFGIHDLLSRNLAPAAGTIFALALLLSGTSAGIVCTMAGQMVSEGMLTWTIKPWMRRLITRSISITPSIIIAAAVGKEGLNHALTASQVVLSVILPFVTAPLIYFTTCSKYMTVKSGGSEPFPETRDVNMRNGWFVATVAVLVWLVLVIMNVALLVLVGLGKA